jgi:hypothetical protein
MKCTVCGKAVTQTNSICQHCSTDTHTVTDTQSLSYADTKTASSRATKRKVKSETHDATLRSITDLTSSSSTGSRALGPSHSGRSRRGLKQRRQRRRRVKKGKFDNDEDDNDADYVYDEDEDEDDDDEDEDEDEDEYLPGVDELKLMSGAKAKAFMKASSKMMTDDADDVVMTKTATKQQHSENVDYDEDIDLISDDDDDDDDENERSVTTTATTAAGVQSSQRRSSLS